MAPKRNEPCHCGSGRKYKQCHMKEDNASRPAPQPPPLIFPTSDPKPRIDNTEDIDPEVALLDRFYEEFQAAGYEERVSILRSAIEEEVLDEELAFEFFNELYSPMMARGHRKEFMELASLLRSNQPEIYEAENHWFWSWEIAAALVLDDDDALQFSTDQMLEKGGEDLDQFFPVFNLLLYHDRRDILLAAMNKQTPQIKADKYFEGVEAEMNQMLSDLIVLHYVESQGQDDLLNEKNLDALCSKIVVYTENIQRDVLIEFISRIGGLTSGQWTLADFVLSTKSQGMGRWEDEYDDEESNRDLATDHLSELSWEFLYYARQTENIPLVKADLARENLFTYIIERHRGQLQDGGSSNSSKRSRRASKIKRNNGQGDANILLPDHKTLDRYLLRFYGFLGNGTHEGATFFELIPTWVRFLQSKGLVTQEQGEHTIRSLRPLWRTMTQMMDQMHSDPNLAVNMRRWGEMPKN